MRLLLSGLCTFLMLLLLLNAFERKGWLSVVDIRRMQVLKTAGWESNRISPNFSPGIVKYIERINPKKRLEFLGINAEKFYRMAAVIAIVSGLLGSILLRSYSVFPLVVITVSISILIIVDKVYQRRTNLFESSMEEAVQSIIASLQAGMNLAQSFEVIADNKTTMASEAFRRIMDEYRVGYSLQAAVKNISRVIDSQDIHFFAQTIEIYYSSGGDVTEILDSMLLMIRRRRQVKGDLEAKTSEVRMTANLLIVLPILLIGYLSIFQSEMVEPLFTNSLGQITMIAGLFLWGTGVILVKKLTRIRH